MAHLAVAEDHCPATPAEELANSLTHGIGALLSVAALVLMVVAAALERSAARVVACSIYGASLVLLYSFSTVYHALTNARAKRVFRILDHSSIYLLIAGTYTPFTLVTLHGAWGWALFGVVWGCAALGIAFKVFFTGRMEVLSTVVYVGMGWVALVAVGPLMRRMPGPGLLWLVAGGLFYTAGVAFYRWRRRYAHAVWHLFVLAGSACHFVAVWGWVLGPAGGPR